MEYNQANIPYIKFWNFISMSHVLIPVVTSGLFINNVNAKNAIGTIGASGASVGAEFMKNHLFPDNLRPTGACDCNIMCNNGPQDMKSGMPSGHSATAAFVAIFYGKMANEQLKGWKKIIAMSGLGGFYVCTVIARYLKKCHSIQQITAGTLYGISLAMICDNLSNIINREQNLKCD
jgi:hypothetical protein